MTATRKGVADDTLRKRRKIVLPMLKAIGEEGISLLEAVKRAKRPYMTVMDWIDADPVLSVNYARARDLRADVLHHQMVRAATEPRPAVVVTEGERDGKPFSESKRGDAVDARRLEVDTLKWVLGRMAPKRFGEVTKIEQTVSGPEGRPMQVEARVNVSVDDSLARLRAKFQP